jgi:hypothetical protein
MRALRSLGAPSLGLVLLLAGCLGASEQPLVQDGDNPPPGSTPVADPPAANATGGARNATSAVGGLAAQANAWAQGQWGGRGEVVLVDETATVDNLVSIAGVSPCLLDCTGAFFTPGKLFVPPGTASVEVTPTFTAPTPTTKVRLYYHTAADAPIVGVDVEPASTLSIPTGPEDADAPLQPASLWWFFFIPYGDPAGTTPDFELSAKIVAKRGAGELPVFGEPKDPWASGPSIALAHDSADVTLCVGCAFGWDASGPGLVAPGAGKLHATVAWTWAGPTKATLHYANMLSNDIKPLEMVEDGDASRTFELAAPSGELDSPYQQRSGWGFIVFADANDLPGPVALGSVTVDVQVLHA